MGQQKICTFINNLKSKITFIYTILHIGHWVCKLSRLFSHKSSFTGFFTSRPARVVIICFVIGGLGSSLSSLYIFRMALTYCAIGICILSSFIFIQYSIMFLSVNWSSWGILCLILDIKVGVGYTRSSLKIVPFIFFLFTFSVNKTKSKKFLKNIEKKKVHRPFSCLVS